MVTYSYAWPLSPAIRVLSSRSNPNRVSLLSGNEIPKPFLAFFPSPSPRFSSSVVFSRRRKGSSVPQTQLSKPKNTLDHDDMKEDEPDYDDDDDNDADYADEDDPLEALYRKLEEDLKNDKTFSDNEDDEITEDDFAKVEKELDEALFDEKESDGMDYSEEVQPKLKNWQLRLLARALKTGRRKTAIKSLSAEVGLERAYVLELLRQPPPSLLMMSASLPDEVAEKVPKEASLDSEKVPKEASLDSEKLPMEASLDSEKLPMEASLDSEKELKTEAPIHVKQANWMMRKRIKKVQLSTLEKVYARTKRPSNTMISSIIHLTNLPWKKVVKWFEDKRAEDGISDLHRRKLFRSYPKSSS